MQQEIFDNYVKAGKIAAQAREFARQQIKAGASLREVSEETEQKILSLGGEMAFPVQISLNKFAAHYCASEDDAVLFSENDVVKADVGVEVEGCIGDTACTVYLGDDEKMKLLVKAAEEALEAAIKIIRPGISLGELGAAIEKEITKYKVLNPEYKFTPVKNLTGHGLGTYNIHAAPQIPNYDNKDNKTFLHYDQVIAIEPFATTGIGLVGQGSAAEVFQMVAPKSVRSPITRDVMKAIQGYKQQPFCRRWLVRKFGPVRTNFALREIVQLGMVQEYPPLPEVTGMPVSQAEHTIIVRDGPIVTTRI